MLRLSQNDVVVFLFSSIKLILFFFSTSDEKSYRALFLCLNNMPLSGVYRSVRLIFAICCNKTHIPFCLCIPEGHWPCKMREIDRGRERERDPSQPLLYSNSVCVAVACVICVYLWLFVYCMGNRTGNKGGSRSRSVPTQRDYFGLLLLFLQRRHNLYSNTV